MSQIAYEPSQVFAALLDCSKPEFAPKPPLLFCSISHWSVSHKMLRLILSFFVLTQKCFVALLTVKESQDDKKSNISISDYFIPNVFKYGLLL